MARAMAPRRGSKTSRGVLPGHRCAASTREIGLAPPTPATSGRAPLGERSWCSSTPTTRSRLGFCPAIDRALDEHPFVACRYDTRTLNPEAVHASLGDAQSSDLPIYDYPAFLPHAGGGGLAIRRAHHEAIGGFDESYPALEDTDYCWRLQLAGVPLVFAGDAVVRIRLKTGTGAIFRQGLHFGLHNVRIYRDYRSHRERGMPVPGAPARD